ncbi:MAG: sigma-70 family RNA polymerase sigma factor [Planctomycetota bacterium]
MTSPFNPDNRDKKLCTKVLGQFRDKGFELPGKAEADWDMDALSGIVLDLFKNTGNEFYFEAFHRLNSKRVIRLISRSPWASAWSFNHAEVAAEIFSDIFRFVNTFTFKGGASFRAWIRVITKNKIKRKLRSAAAGPLVYTSDLTEITARDLSDPLPRLICEESALMLIAGWKILLRLCAQGIRLETTRLEREVLRLHESEGLSYEDLSSRMGISRREAILAARRGRRKVAAYIRSILAASARTIPTSRIRGSG